MKTIIRMFFVFMLLISCVQKKEKPIILKEKSQKLWKANEVFAMPKGEETLVYEMDAICKDDFDQIIQLYCEEKKELYIYFKERDAYLPYELAMHCDYSLCGRGLAIMNVLTNSSGSVLFKANGYETFVNGALNRKWTDSLVIANYEFNSQYAKRNNRINYGFLRIVYDEGLKIEAKNEYYNLFIDAYVDFINDKSKIKTSEELGNLMKHYQLRLIPEWHPYVINPPFVPLPIKKPL